MYVLENQSQKTYVSNAGRLAPSRPVSEHQASRRRFRIRSPRLARTYPHHSHTHTHTHIHTRAQNQQPVTSSSYPFATLLTGKAPPTPPTVGAVVTATVIKTNIRTVNLEISPRAPLTETFSGLLRASDVRSSDIDSVELHKCFRPGDIVRARVLSLGDQRAYYLTTAEDELGVVKARSARTGSVLVPLDRKTVVCPETNETEERKAAWGSGSS